MLEIKNAGDQEWLNARGKKSLRSARWHLCSLSLASLLLDPTVACTLHFQCYTVQRSLPISVLYITIFTIISASCTTIFTKRFRSTYIHIYIYIYIFIYTSSDSTAYAQGVVTPIDSVNSFATGVKVFDRQISTLTS